MFGLWQIWWKVCRICLFIRGGLFFVVRKSGGLGLWYVSIITYFWGYML